MGRIREVTKVLEGRRREGGWRGEGVESFREWEGWRKSRF